jgi:methionine-rich copper-binding protein CopC
MFAATVVAVVCLPALPALTSHAAAASDPCASAANKVACENLKPGDPFVGDDTPEPSIQGFTTDISSQPGDTVHFKINTDASNYSIDIYRVGWYQGAGNRKVASITPSASLPQTQPACLTTTDGLTDCGNWAESASWSIPSDAVSGVYFAYLRRADTGATNQIVFVVRDQTSHSDILVQTDDETWQAYNSFGGNSLYVGSTAATGSQPGRAYKVSYNRPIFGDNQNNNFWKAEFQMVKWLELNGYDVSYQSGIDTDRLGAANIEQHKVFMSSGHDEYWTGQQRANVQAARDAGVNLAFFSGNSIFWKTRLEPSIDGSNTPDRTLVTYKETLANAKIDPSSEWTGTWRDPRFSPPADGGKPENALAGTIFTVNGTRTDSITVGDQFSKLRFWRNTDVAALAPGQSVTFPAGTLGYEWNSDLDNGFRPAGLFDLSSTQVTVPSGFLIQDYGSFYGAGTATHNMTLYKAASGALVFSAGTVQWSWGLDPQRLPDVRMQQATVNLLADMGVQPTTLQDGLVPATQSTDNTAPTTAITTPSDGATVQTGSPITISGTATDAGGGVVAGVEVSVDGGSTWHPASGTSNWTYQWVPANLGPATIEARATDDSANLGSPATVSPTVAVGCPCSLFTTSTPTNASASDPASVELGVKWTADVDGLVTGIRFYKGPSNNGTHTGSLWTSTGTLLSSATFTNETASGWQTVTFPTPVAVSAGTTYVASYHAPTGGYATTPYYFSAGPPPGIQAIPVRDAAPLHAPMFDGTNGVYRYGASTIFPNNSFQSTNYYVDVVFTQDTSTPTVSAVTPTDGSTGVPISTQPTAVFSKPVQPSTINFTLTGPSGPIAGTTAYDAPTHTATFQPTQLLPSGVSITASVSGAKDSAGTVAAPISWSFTTGGIKTCPCTVWPSSATPVTASTTDHGSVELGMRFRADADGYITGVRFYKGASNTGTHTGSLWTNSGQLLATATFTNETATGWQQVQFANPVQVTANTTYVVSYHAPSGGYASDANYFKTTGVDNSPLHALQDGVDGPDGAFVYKNGTAFPTTGFNSTNYWVDTVFVPDTLPPAIVSKTPTPGVTNAPSSTRPTVTFNEPIVASQLSFVVTDASNNPVPGTVAYDSDTRTATFNPTNPFPDGGTYTASVSNAQDPSGNVLAGTTSWTFQLSGRNACPCSVFPSDQLPVTPAASDGATVELGFRFRTDVSGVVQGVKFYKGAGNIGTHTGSLWTNTGQQLATATFTNETASGWQTVLFSNPVAISANTTYVASYHAPKGHYSYSPSYFASTGVDNSPVHALPNGLDGFSGSFLYNANTVFPSSSGSAANYWVDVVFQPDGSGPPDVTPPTTAGTTPAPGATAVPVAGTVTTTFSEPVQPSSIAFTLRDPANKPIAGTKTYNITTRQFTFTPTAPLTSTTTYAATLSGARDLSENVMAPQTWSFTTQDIVAPTVKAFTPPNNTANLPVTTQPTVTFSESVQPATIGFTLKDSANNQVAGTVSYDDSTHTATFAPSAPLASSTVYTASVTGAKDLAGNTMAGTTSWIFGIADVIAPTVTAVTPADGSTNVLLSVAPTMTFSEPINANTPSINLKGPDGVKIPGNTTYDTSSRTLTFHPAAGLASLTTYTISVVSERDNAGNVQTTPFTWSFTTGDYTPPQITAQTPAPGATGVARNTTVTATLSEDIQPGTLSMNVEVAEGNQIGGNVSYDPSTRTATFTPSGQLAEQTTYTAVVGGASDTAGNVMAPTAWSFTTADTTPPTVTAQSPANGTTGQPANTAPAATFSESMQGDTVAMSLTGPSGAVTGTTSYDETSKTATFTPDAPLASGTSYTAAVTAGQDLAGNNLASTSQWSFTTGDFIAPTVTATTPANGATNQPSTTKPTATFSEPVQAGTIAFTLAEGATNIPGSVSYDSASRTATLTPTASLPNGATLTATVSGAQDTAGNTMAPTSWSFTTGDSTPPTISARTPANGATAQPTNTAPTATFSEPVQAGTIAFTLKQGSTNISGTVSYDAPSNTAKFTPNAALAQGTTYTATVSGAKDLAGNTMSPSSWTFTTRTTSTVTDSTTANFAAGTLGAGSYIAGTGDGEVQLAPTAGSEFGGTALPSGWTSTNVAPFLQSTTVSGGNISVDGTRASTTATFSQGRWLEFSANFRSNTANQSGGFGTNLSTGSPWAIFQTKSDGRLYARTEVNGSSSTETSLGTTYLDGVHTFRIEWTAGKVVYKVDGATVATHNLNVTTPMSLLLQDSGLLGQKLVSSWMRMGPYASTGTFTSRVLDAGQASNWDVVSWVASLPAGSGVTVSVRTGNVSTPNASWTAFTPITSGGSVGANARYAQYQITMSQATDGSSPNLSSISLTYYR